MGRVSCRNVFAYFREESREAKRSWLGGGNGMGRDDGLGEANGDKVQVCL